ncbi:hypothetical protein L1887_01295 [Cichorium endivia]|nr:hypothetical protein L1887_01295 [Cichorium endivia]
MPHQPNTGATPSSQPLNDSPPAAPSPPAASSPLATPSPAANSPISTGPDPDSNYLESDGINEFENIQGINENSSLYVGYRFYFPCTNTIAIRLREEFQSTRFVAKFI